MSPPLGFAIVGTGMIAGYHAQAIVFGDQPVFRETSDTGAGVLGTAYIQGTVSVTLPPGPPLQVGTSGTDLVISWPASATGFQLEGTAGPLGSAWSPVSSFPVGTQRFAIVSMTGDMRFFRLKKP